jgi:alcohol dehydrogenase class IV
MIQTILKNISIVDLYELVNSKKVNNIFLVTGKDSYVLSGAKEFIDSFISLFDNKILIHRFCDFSTNPKLEEILKGVEKFKSNKCDFIIAIGGGSVIDVAKAINVIQCNERNTPEELVLNNLVEEKGVELLAVPTTSGSGSEATHFAVVYISGKKYSLTHEFVLPNFVGLNYKFTMSQSPYQTACSGLDAFSQAIEAYWSLNATSVSDEFALKAFELIYKNLTSSVVIGDSLSRELVFRGANLAGRAINIAKTTAAHALSYSITTQYGIPHGHAVFLSIPNFLVYNYNLNTETTLDLDDVIMYKRKMENIFKILEVSDIRDAKIKLLQLAKTINVELSLSKLNIDKSELINVLDCNLERLKNNPRKIDIHNLNIFFQD